MSTHFHLLHLITFLAAFPLNAEELPTPWRQADVGTAELGKSAKVAGTVTHAQDAFAVSGTMDLWGPADGFHFVWQPVQGDVVLVARVTSIDNPGGVDHAKASLCIRESFDGGSCCVTQCTTPGDGTQFTYRDTTDGKTVRIFADAATPMPSVPKGEFPCWLKLVRRGNEFSGFESLDGETWWLTGKIKLDFKADAVIGIASSSHTEDTLTTSVFDRVQLSKFVAGGNAEPAIDPVRRAGVDAKGQ